MFRWMFIGGMILAFLGAAKPGSSLGQWPDTTWLFLVGFTFACLSVWLWRRSQSNAHASTTPDAEADVPKLIADVKGVTAASQALANEAKAADFEQVANKAQQLIFTYINPIVDEQAAIIRHFGMAKGSEFLLSIARGERLLNRVQTAALDEHRDEIKETLPQATLAFSAAFEII